MDTSGLPLPPLFVSHGSPMTALEPGAAGACWQQLGQRIDARFGRPRAILGLSAHTLTRKPLVLGAERHEAVHDFGGFDQRLYAMRYDAPGAPLLAERAGSLLRAAGIDAQLGHQGGLDHGLWVPLRFLWPQADVPVLPIGWPPNAAPAELFRIGEALAPLAAEGVLILGSGSITHNLRLALRGMHAPGEAELPESAAFRRWWAERSAARDHAALFGYRDAPGIAAVAREMHPTDEHLLPWFIAAGAGGRDAAPVRLHESVVLASLGMDVYAFGPQAALLADAPAPAPVAHTAA